MTFKPIGRGDGCGSGDGDYYCLYEENGYGDGDESIDEHFCSDGYSENEGYGYGECTVSIKSRRRLFINKIWER